MLKNKYLTKICLSLLALVFATELFSFVILAYTKIFLNRIENNSITDAELSFSDWIERYGEKIDGFSFLIRKSALGRRAGDFSSKVNCLVYSC